MTVETLDKSRLSPAALEKLRGIFGKAGVSDSDLDRIAYSRDLWPKGMIWLRRNRTPWPPGAVVWPTDAEQVSELLKLANEDRFPVIPMGAGSGVCGATLPWTGGVVMDLKKMDRIIEIDDKSLLAVIEPGIIGQTLEHELNRRGYTMGHFPSSIYCSSLGGFLSTRAAGQLSTKYGKIEDMVKGLEVVLPSGETVRTRPVPRSATGPNFTQLYVGAEGTLGVITRATMRIHPYPETRLFRGVMFKTVPQGLEAIRKIMRAGIAPAAVRLYDEIDTFLVGSSGKGTRLLGEELQQARESFFKKLKHDVFGAAKTAMIKAPPMGNKVAELFKGKCLLVLTFEGTRRLALNEFDESMRIASEVGGVDLGEEPGIHWWNHRYDVSYNQSQVYDAGSFLDTMEVSVNWSAAAELYARIREAVSSIAFIMAHFSHAYPEGVCIYFSFVARDKDLESEQERYAEVWNKTLAVVHDMGASISHHHGVGISKAMWLKRELGGNHGVMVAIKRALDPNNILNPGKLGLPGGPELPEDAVGVDDA